MPDIDIRDLGLSDVVRLINSLPGPPVSAGVVRRHKNLAGFQIGPGARVDLVRYASWLIEVRRNPRPRKPDAGHGQGRGLG